MKIDHIYCLNLERSVERREKIGKEFEKESLDVEFFKGCDGKAIGKSGVFGCAQSHINIWKDVVEKGYENVLIFEDDVWLEKDFKQFFTQYDKRRGKDFVSTFPRLKNWYESIQT